LARLPTKEGSNFLLATVIAGQGDEEIMRIKVTFEQEIPDEVNGQKVTFENAVDWVRFNINDNGVLSNCPIQGDLDPVWGSVKVEKL
jgi:hypothetical protein